MYYYTEICSPHESHENFIFPRYNTPIRIRFGDCKFRKQFAIELNLPKDLSRVRDKILMKCRFESCGIPSPRFWLVAPTVFPCVMKKREHSGGNGMLKINSSKDLPRKSLGKYIYEEFVDCDMEFRIHVIGTGQRYKIFHADTKTLRPYRSETWVRNLENYIYKKTKLVDVPEPVQFWSIQAVKVLNICVGAVDIGYNSSTGSVWVYEVNSAPGMRPSLQKKYNKALIEYIENEIGVW